MMNRYMASQQKRIYKLSIIILLLTQIVTAIPLGTSSLLSMLWLIWIVICSYCALKICLEKREKGENLFAVLILLFWSANIISYFISPRHVSSSYAEVDTIVIVKSITIAFFSYFPFYYFSKKGVIDYNNLRFFIIALFITSFFRLLFDSRRLSTENSAENNVLNIAYLFALIIPLIMIAFRKGWLFFLITLSSLFVLWGSKRGAILCLLVELLCFFVYILRDDSFGKRHKGRIILLLSILFAIGFYYISNNAFLQGRLLTTGTDEDMSGVIRREMYQSLFELFMNTSSIKEILFGHGLGQTVGYVGNLAHQDWLELLIDNGIVVLFIYILLIVVTINSISKCQRLKTKVVKYSLICCILVWVLMASYSILYASRDSFLLFISLGVIEGFIQRGQIETNKR